MTDPDEPTGELARDAHTVRVTKATTLEIARYAAEHGVSMNAAFNVILRKGLRALEAEEIREGKRCLPPAR